MNLEVDQGNETKLKSLVGALRARPDSSLTAEERKLRDLYGAYVDTEGIEAAGLAPVRADLERIGALKTLAEVAAFMGNPPTGTYGPFAAHITIDQANPAAYAVRLMQSGLGMPDRDYYLSADKDVAATREAYKKYLADMLGSPASATPSVPPRSLPWSHARAGPLAGSRTARRGQDLQPDDPRALAHLAPQFPWNAFLGAKGIPPRAPLRRTAGGRGREIRLSEAGHGVRRAPRSRCGATT